MSSKDFLADSSSQDDDLEDLDEDEYIVEKILDKKWVKERKRFEVSYSTDQRIYWVYIV